MGLDEAEVVKRASDTMREWGQFADDAMKTHGPYENSVKHAVELLHDLGVIIHYPDDPQLRGIVFVDTQWLVNVVKLVVRHNMAPYLKDLRGLVEDDADGAYGERGADEALSDAEAIDGFGEQVRRNRLDLASPVRDVSI